MSDEINEKLINEIITLSQLSNHRLREQTLKLIELYKNEKKHSEKIKKNNLSFLKQVDKRTVAMNATSIRKDKLLAQQSKMAAMGEMMDAVAHQWKQPLNSLSIMNEMLDDDFKENLVDEAYIEELTQTTQIQIDHMVNTLSEFRTFFRPSKGSTEFYLQESVESVQVLMKDELIKNNINLHIDLKDNIKINGLVNEFKHLFLNLLSNSIDAFNEKEIKQRDIYIRSHENNETRYIEFEDSAGGIAQHVINDIFKPNVTTKGQGKGTGIGLYMSSQIVQKSGGRIDVKNSNMGALFTITLR
ncbi:MAG: HAMP domain-containing histidine kinase [Sulfurimonas sp.]|nr:HAMP domain-containing histidine kinase [Sulfurimonas sp.]